MVSVRVQEYRIVKPSTSPPYTIPLLHSCKLDLVIANIFVKTVYFFEGNGSPNFFSTATLSRSLSQALSLFYPFAGTITDPDFDIECNGQGALYVDALADCSITDLGDLKPDPQLLQLIPTLDDFVNLTTQPLLIVQVTRFICGGVAFGLGLEHHAADGVSALHFLKAWSTIARGEVYEGSPWFDKTWLKARSPPAPQFVHDEYLKLPKPPKLHTHSNEARDANQESTVRMFDLPIEWVQRLKRLGGGELSTYELLAAHVWKCCCEARELPNEEETMLIMAVDGRSRLSGVAEMAPENYVGNVILNCCPVLKVGDIVGSDVVKTGTMIRAAIKRMDDSYCRSAIDFLQLCDMAQLRSFVKGSHTFASPNVGFISWTKFPFYEIDFGWGSAVHVGPVHVPWEGHAYLMASPPSKNKKSERMLPPRLRLCISLQRRHMDKFANLVCQEAHLA